MRTILIKQGSLHQYFLTFSTISTHLKHLLYFLKISYPSYFNISDMPYVWLCMVWISVLCSEGKHCSHGQYPGWTTSSKEMPKVYLTSNQQHISCLVCWGWLHCWYKNNQSNKNRYGEFTRQYPVEKRKLLPWIKSDKNGYMHIAWKLKLKVLHLFIVCGGGWTWVDVRREVRGQLAELSGLWGLNLGPKPWQQCPSGALVNLPKWLPFWLLLSIHTELMTVNVNSCKGKEEWTCRIRLS